MSAPGTPEAGYTVSRSRRALRWMALALILACAAVLRLDALFDTHGPYAAPAWLGPVQAAVSRVSPLVVPRDWSWPRVADIYGGGDPHNYLRFAREMTHVYQPHVREPAYLLAVRAGLFATGDEDVGISLVSIAFAVLVALATYLVGRDTVSRAAGLLAALAVSIDRDAVEWSTGGWRDEMFTFVSLFAVWLWLRSTRIATTRSALVAGLATGAACLTRLTAPFMLAATAVWMLSVRDAGLRRQRARLLVAGGTVAAVVVMPYLISCAIAFGDPFYAINYHTQFYLGREGASPEIVSSASYIVDKFVSRPLATTDTALQGLFVFPFQIKWRGLEAWVPGLGTALGGLSAGGLIAWLFVPRGRLLLGMLFGSLVPYMITWSIPGGAEWRFTFHAYPFYLLAAFGFAGSLLTAVRSLGSTRFPWRAAARRAVIVAGLGAAGLTWWWGMPALTAAEALQQRRPAALEAGPRDRWLLRRGWSGLSVTGNVTTRFATSMSAEIALPLPEQRDYRLVLRVDPIPRDDLPAQRVGVELNGVTLGLLELTWDPDLVGRYELDVPRHLVAPKTNVLRLRPEALFEAGPIVDRYPALSPDDRVGLRFWYVLIQPVEVPSGGGASQD